MFKISAIIPTNNDLKLGILEKIFSGFAQHTDIEVIVVDLASSDGTERLTQTYKYKYIATTKNSRGARLNIGIQNASAQMLLLHHPRSIITQDGIRALLDISDRKIWGGFTHSFDLSHPLLNFTSWYSNKFRGHIKKILYLDHCIFVRKELLGPSPYVPEVDIFEDTLLSEKLNKIFPPIILSQKVITSAIRFQKNGILRQSVINQILKLGYHLNIPHTLMNSFYEKNLNLNSKYDNKAKTPSKS